MKAGLSIDIKYTNYDETSTEGSNDGFILKEKSNIQKKCLSKNIQTTNISSQAIALAKSIKKMGNLYKQNNSLLKKPIETENIKITYATEKNICLDRSATHFTQPSENVEKDVNKQSVNLIEKTWTESYNIPTSLNISEHSVHVASSKDNYKIKIRTTPSGNRLFKVLKEREEVNPKLKKKPFKTSNDEKQFHTSHVNIKLGNESKSQLLKNVKTELQHKHENNEKTYIKFEKDARTYKIKCPLIKTLSGNIAININKLRGEFESKHKECTVFLARSDSGAIFINKDIDGNAYGVIKSTTSGTLLLFINDPTYNSKETVKKNAPPKEKLLKFKIETDGLDFPAPFEVLKTTPSQNYLLMSNKNYEDNYEKTVEDLLKTRTEYFINLTKSHSQNCVPRVNDSWEKGKPNVLVVNPDSGDENILNNNGTLLFEDSEHKGVPVKRSMIMHNNVSNKLPKGHNSNSSMPSTSSKKSITKKFNSDSNVYEKHKLFYSGYKDLLGEASEILKTTKLGQNEVVLDKGSKISFIKNIRSYLKNHHQSAVPIKQTVSGEITISLNNNNSHQTSYGSLKITPSGNLFVVADKKLVKALEKEESLSVSTENNSVTEIASTHIIGNLKCPINKAVTTTCNAKPGSDCEENLCTCEHIRFNNIDWVRNRNKTINFFGSQLCGVNWRKVTSYSNGSSKIYDKCTENDDASTKSDSKALPHIVIKPCTGEVLNISQDNQQKCCCFFESFCPYKENLRSWTEFSQANNTCWDSLSFLPPQLPDFLKDIKY